MIRKYVKGANSNAPIFFVGLKSDLRSSMEPPKDGQRPPIERSAAEALANSAHVDGFFEVSAKDGEGLTDLVEKIIREIDSARENPLPPQDQVVDADDLVVSKNYNKSNMKMKKEVAADVKGDQGGFFAKVKSALTF